MIDRPLRLRAVEAGVDAWDVYEGLRPTGDVILRSGRFPMFETLGVPGQFFFIWQALDALEQDMELTDAAGG